MKESSNTNPYESSQIVENRNAIVSEDATSADANPGKYPKRILNRLLMILTIMNLLVLAGAYLTAYATGPGPDTMVALIFPFLIGPVLNGIVIIISLLSIPALRYSYSKFPVGRHVAISIVLPIIAAIPFWGWAVVGFLLLINLFAK